MRYVIIAMLVLSGCAGKTIHQRCQEDVGAGEYRDYDQCYASYQEKAASDAAARQNFLKAVADSYKTDDTTTRCSSYVYGNNIQTNCR